MDDLISRRAAIDALDALCDRECEYSKQQRSFMCGACRLGSAFDVLENLPSVQPEVIRCKDCKYCDSYIAEITSDGNMERMEYRCKDFHASVMPDEYCSRGERRDV